MEAGNLVFPDINEVLYRAKTLKEAEDLYIKSLKEAGGIYNVLYANKIMEYKALTTNLANISLLESDFCELKSFLSNWKKQNNIKYTISIFKRKKNFIAYNEKIRLFLQTGRPLAKILDVLGFRIIIGNGIKDDMASVECCYKILTEIINFFVYQKNCYPLEAEPLTDAKFIKEDYPQIIVPSKPLLPSEFAINVKDYIQNPKENGYQSLHVVIHSPSGFYFEIQIRTQAMHFHAEFLTARHDNYKDSRYPSRIEFDRSKVNMLGYAYKDGKVHDLIGLETSIDPFNILS